jgi:retinol dehydrogenase-12
VYTNFGLLSIVLNVFFARGLSERLRDKPLIVNTVNPGFCYSALRRNITGLRAWTIWLMELVLARTAEEGSRQLIWACIGGKDNIDQLRGAYISSMQVQEPSDFVISEEGKRAQTKLWVNNYSSYRIILTKLLGCSDRRVSEKGSISTRNC